MSDFSSVTLPQYSVESRVESRPPWEPRTRFEIEREASEIRGTLKTLSEAVGSALDVLLQTEARKERQTDDESRRREALECLDYVREVLGQRSRGDQGPLDEERLWGEKELQRRKKVEAEMKQATSKSSDNEGISVTTKVVPISHPTRAASVSEGSPVRSRGGSLPAKPPEKSNFVRSSGKIVAPWNHTPSSFSSSTPSFLPAPPPALAPPPPARTSTRPGSDDGKIHQDPLGVLR